VAEICLKRRERNNMLKAEELKIVDQIERLIDHAGEESYIAETFSGICDICRRNIQDDAYNRPVLDLQNLREKYDEDMRKKDIECGEMLRKLEHENNVLQEKLTNAESSLLDYKTLCQKQSEKISEMQEGLDVCTDTMDQDEKDIAELQNEIVRLKEEIYDLRRELNK
jgi:chromosome segregation ATPase